MLARFIDCGQDAAGEIDGWRAALRTRTQMLVEEPGSVALLGLVTQMGSDTQAGLLGSATGSRKWPHSLVSSNKIAFLGTTIITYWHIKLDFILTQIYPFSKVPYDWRDATSQFR